jgi:hypothetical protein
MARKKPERNEEDRPSGPGNSDYTEEHEKVFAAVVAAHEEHRGERVHLAEIAQRSDMPRERVRELLLDLAKAQRLIIARAATDGRQRSP